MKKIQSNSINYTLLVIVWVITIISLFKFVPRNKIRQASMIYLFKQLLTWLFGLIVVEFKLIQYPKRLFKRANATSFTFEYFVFPSICIIFNLYYPITKSLSIKLLYHILYSASMTGIELLFERFTLLIKYTNWKWYYTFISLTFTFYLSRVYYQWFFKTKRNPFSM
ncbi:CBO0543 family protein [Halalkalibacter hemicellulosilyticus]|uniref:CBO0543 family protein n=1 Tax=Halalkalibacter hemicellulosilyticus TaxID=127886 RepID=UPI000690D644|nr:CBO0543 family protein [Halalkalibacter hemicellulosilyticus]